MSEEHRIVTRAKVLQMVKTIPKYKDVTKLLDLEIKAGSSKGDNFSGEVIACNFKVKVGDQTDDIHWMIKVPPADKERYPVMRAMHVEDKEIKMYTEVIKTWKRMAKEHKADIEFNYCEAPYFEFDENSMEKESIIVMENLTFQGYKEAENKQKGLRADYIKTAMEEIAKFHAAGHVWLNSYPGGIEEGLKVNSVLATDYFCAEPEPIVQKMNQQFEWMINMNIKELLEAVQEPGQDFVGIWDRFNKKHNAMKMRDTIYSPSKDGFNVLCHGDTWFNNMFFKHDENGKATKCALIDLAMTRYATPIADLSYFLFLSTTPQMRETELEKILGWYHDEFVRTLAKLGGDPAVYPFRQLVKDYKKYNFVGLYMALWILPLMLADKEDKLGQDDFSGDWGDEENALRLMAKTKEMYLKAVKNTPQIKFVLAGNFIEVIKSGFFDDVL